MAIKGLQVKALRNFRGGRIGNENPATMPETHGLIARDVFFLGDGNVRRRKGYTLVATLPAKPFRGYHFERQTDGKAFSLISGVSRIGYMSPDGVTIPYADISIAEDASAAFSFINDNHSAYCGNGHNMYRLIDNGDGKLTAYTWGLSAPLGAPTINTTTVGGLTLTYGRSYVICKVARWTDSKGTARYHIGTPSPISAHTGPITGKVVTLGGIAVDADPQVTHYWIFATQDMPFDTSGFYAFAAEITNGTTSWADTLTDAQLDTTRQAPWDNFPAPFADKVLEYQSRAVLLAGNVVYVSGNEEIDLGIAMAAFPAALQFPVPTGTKRLTGGAVVQQMGTSILLVGTPDFWFMVTGQNASNLVKYDKIIQPGPVGFDAVGTLPGWVVFFGPDKKLWAWDCQSSTPIELSLKISQTFTGDPRDALTLDDISDAQLATVRVVPFSYGKYYFILVMAQTSGAPANFYDWFQVWDASLLTRGSYSELMQSNTGQLMAESDMFPFHEMVTAWVERVGNAQYVFLGDILGNIYRFPDGTTDAGAVINNAVFGTIVTDLEEPGVEKQMLFADLLTNRQDAKDLFTVYAAATKGLVRNLRPTDCSPLIERPGGVPDSTIARAQLMKPGCAFGTFVQVIVKFPTDDQDTALAGIDVSFRPVYEEAP